MLHSICQLIWKTQQWPQGWKRSVFIPIPKKGNAKECSNYPTQLHSFYLLTRSCSKSPRLQQHLNWKLPDVKTGFRKGTGTGDEIFNIHWIIKKAREFQEKSYFCFSDYAKAFDCVDFNKLWKILQEVGNTRPVFWEICMQVKKQQLELDMDQQTGSKLGKEYVKAIYCHSVYLTYMKSTSWEMLGWMKNKLESRLPGEISVTSDMQMTAPLWQKAKKS